MKKAKSESQILREVMLALGSRPDVRIWRNNTGVALTKDGRRIKFGLARGSSDLIGLKTETVTEGMVGRRVGVFTAVELKSEDGRLSPQQERFIECVRRFGGRAITARSLEEVEKLLEIESEK